MMKRYFFPLLALLAATLAVAATQWQMAPKQSTLRFVGKQAGAPFTGNFENFSADIRFDPNDLADSRFNVTIEMKSVNSKDKERDDTLRGGDLFAVQRYPEAIYRADRFADQGGGRFTALGTLTLRDETRDTPVDFTFQPSTEGVWLKGTATLKRLDFGVGQGEWKDTQWVSNDVRVEFALLLTK
jgi:polyisoprenoid-binding protein YceI